MQVEIRYGYMSGVVGRITEMRALWCAREWGFGQFFESQVATGLAEFAGRLSNPGNQLWRAEGDGRVVGAVAIDGEHLGGGVAHPRWFVMDDACRGLGVGRRLLEAAVEFCDRRGFAATQLWTFQGLDAARHLYEDLGFRLVECRPGAQWGSPLVEQRFVRPGAAAPIPATMA
jgi:GNAT superfamily N-acetyltransferase